MAFNCTCDGSLSNMGSPSCQSLNTVTKKIIYVPLRDTAGVRNSILSSDVIDQTYFDGKLNESDPSKRWYTTMSTIENVEDTKDASVFESLNSGQNIFIQEGPRTFVGMYIKQSYQFLGKLKSGLCTQFGVYLIDLEGNLVGSVSADGLELYPIQVDNETFDAIYMKATDSTVAKVQVTFQYSRTERDENLRIISANDITADILGSNGLLDATIAVSGDTVTALVATVTIGYGTFGKPLKLQGLVAGDFVLYNVTDTAIVTPTSVTETADGVYTFVIPAQTVADAMTLTASKNGFEFNVASYTI